MANIFTLENFSDFSEKINFDELYEKKRQVDLNKLELFKKILNRIHVRIKTTAKHSIHEKFCWFVVPEVIIGVPKYDQAGCIAYLMNSLQENGFNVRYFHPNTLFICWEHWVPAYGEKQEETNNEEDEEQKVDGPIQQIKNSKKYTPINSYKPSGKLVYSEDLLDKIGDKIN